MSDSVPAPKKDEDLKLPGIIDVPYKWLDDRLGINAVIKPVLVHPVPRSTNWFNVLGSATLTAFIFQMVTGVILALSYVPAPNDAYRSLQYIVNTSIMGGFIRGIHYWGASAMILLIFAHTARVFLTGSYKYPREVNWLLGVGLLFATLLMGFTGQLLVWNNDSYWAIVVGAEQAARTPFIGSWVAQLMIAGQTVGAATLTHFYVLHVFVLPGAMIGLISGHLYLVVYQGISEWPEPSNIVDPATYKEKYHKLLEDGIPFFPDAMAKDAIFAAICGFIVIVLALRFGGAPLGDRVNPAAMAHSPKPFWFLIWYFALLAMIPAQIENIVIIGFPAVCIMGMLALPFVANKGERAASKRPWAVGTVFLAVLSTFVLIVQGYLSPWGPVFDQSLPPKLIRNLPGGPSSPAVAGAHLFNTRGCIECHSIDGHGGARGPDLDNVYLTFRGGSISWTRGKLSSQIANGGKGTSFQAMPPYGAQLSATQINDLVTFLLAVPSAETRESSGVTAAVSPNHHTPPKH